MKAEDNIIPWLIRWAAMDASRFLVGKDGKLDMKGAEAESVRFMRCPSEKRYGIKGSETIKSK